MERAELARLLGAGPAEGSGDRVVIAERDPDVFQRVFAQAVAGSGPVFLADPAWGAAERAQFDAAVNAPLADPDSATGWLCIPTGGSSGRMKLARHDQDTLAAAVAGFVRHFGVTRVNAVGLLPLHHVSGLMGWLRCALTGGIHLPWDGGALLEGRMPEIADDGNWFLSLVPTQLARLMERPAAVAWMLRFKAVFVGGGPAWPALIETGARLGLPLSFTYGMTETAAMVTALRPGDFLGGMRGCGAALPHATVTVDGEGKIAIRAESLFRGYYPDGRTAGDWSPDDLGRWDEQGSLHLLGRSDGLIITGGEKVDPLEVESALRATGLMADVAVLGMADEQWGEVVTAFYPRGTDELAVQAVEALLARTLASFKRPKRYVPVTDWPRNAQGKINRAALRLNA